MRPMKTEKAILNWRSRLFLIGGGAASVIWAVTLYWSLVANRYLDTPWIL